MSRTIEALVAQQTSPGRNSPLGFLLAAVAFAVMLTTTLGFYALTTAELNESSRRMRGVSENEKSAEIERSHGRLEEIATLEGQVLFAEFVAFGAIAIAVSLGTRKAR